MQLDNSTAVKPVPVQLGDGVMGVSDLIELWRPLLPLLLLRGPHDLVMLVDTQAHHQLLEPLSRAALVRVLDGCLS